MGRKLLQLALLPLLQGAAYQPRTFWGSSAAHPWSGSWGCQELQEQEESGTFCVSTDSHALQGLKVPHFQTVDPQVKVVKYMGKTVCAPGLSTPGTAAGPCFKSVQLTVKFWGSHLVLHPLMQPAHPPTG
jgi:hypothetical protein